MPTIFDNISKKLYDGLNNTLATAKRADFCVGYFNLRGWNTILGSIDKLEGDYLDERFEDDSKYHCRVLIGMQRLPEDELRAHFSKDDGIMDNSRAVELKKKMAAEFRNQLMIGTPTDNDERTLKHLSRQLHSRQVVIKLHLEFSLHAKLYLAYRDDYNAPKIGYVGSSNLTFAGISRQGELNVDVNDKDAAEKLEEWFQNRWDNRWSIDITEELAGIIDQSWASEKLHKPYHVYMKMAYHLSREARAGISEFNVPKIFKNVLFPFQQNAVQVAAHHLHKRGGVIIGDVVGLGKTITATALAKMFEDDFFLETLIICPKNLVEMWCDYAHDYQLRAKVIPITRVQTELPKTRRFRLVVIDESHNLRNRDGRRYRAIQEYIQLNDSKVILLTATPYNKTYNDLSNQLRLFLDESYNLGVSPERYIESIGGRIQFEATHQVKDSTIAAFEKSAFPEDWAELMRLFLVRRTRSFIKANYAKDDETSGRKYLLFPDGTRSYFPDRLPRKVEFAFDEHDHDDQYAQLYSSKMVDIIDNLILPRYGLGRTLYESQILTKPVTSEESIVKDNLSRAGTRLIGFARTNLFKRLESSGYSFLVSVSRHILKNYLFLYAIENNLPFPIGKQDGGLMDDFLYTDKDADDDMPLHLITTGKEYMQLAEGYYRKLCEEEKKYSWIRSEIFNKQLKNDLLKDCKELMKIVVKSKEWKYENDRKLKALFKLLTVTHKTEKLLIFTQFADTAEYLYKSLQKLGIANIDCATGDCEDPTALAYQFSPQSNKRSVESELRILISTDVLSEGQNLQDAHIVLNYDLPWAIIRLIQRAGRVDRIGQKHHEIFCYSFLPEEGIERIINLRERLRRRIAENAETVGSDEVFFEGDPINIRDLYNEKSGILDDDENIDIDLASYCFQIWKNGTDANPELLKIIPNLPDVIYATKKADEDHLIDRAVVYTKTPNDNDVLALVDNEGQIITQSQYEILRIVKCNPDEQALERIDKHHELVRIGLEHIKEIDSKVGGQLGKRTGARYRVYMRLCGYAERYAGTLFLTDDIKRTIDDIYNFPLREFAKEVINRELKSGIDDDRLIEVVCSLRDEGKLSLKGDENNLPKEPRIICSMGLKVL